MQVPKTSRGIGQIDPQWVKGIKAAWAKAAKSPNSMTTDYDCIEHLESVVSWLDRLAEDLLFNKGFYFLPGPWTRESIPRRLKEKVVGELRGIRDAVVEGDNWIRSVARMMDPETRDYKMDGGRIYQFYRERDPRSPTRAFWQACRDKTEEVLKDATKDFSRKFLASLTRFMNKYQGDIDFGSGGPLEYSIGNMKVIYQDFPRSTRGPLGLVPTEKQVEKGGLRVPLPEDYVRPLSATKALLEKKGLGSLWYGNLYIRCKACGGTNPHGAKFGVGATYHMQGDYLTLFMDPSMRLPALIAHELGHRYYYRFMNARDRSQFDSYFKAVPATSEYGGSSTEEDFAEVFSSYVLGKDLTRDQVERFKMFLGRTSRRAHMKISRGEVPPGGIKTLPRKKWVVVQWSEMAEAMQNVVWDVYDLTYSSIGKHVPDITAFGNKYKFLFLVDLDEDIDPDAFIAFNETPFGRKLALAGTDGGKAAKRAMIQKMIQLAKTKGWYIEASHKIADILRSAGVPVVDDENAVRKVLKGKDLTWVGDGMYSRSLGTSSINATKSLFGRPKVATLIGRFASPRMVVRRFLEASGNWGEDDPDYDHWESLEETGYWGRAGAGLLLTTGEKVLLLERSSYVEQPHTWGAAGGAVDSEEDPMKGALREAKEEMGNVPPHRIIGKYVYRDGDFTYTTFLGKVDPKVEITWKPRLNWENDDWEWVSREDLKRYKLHFGLPPVLRKMGW